MRLDVRRTPDELSLRFEGAADGRGLDAFSADLLHRAIVDHVRDATPIIVDLSDVPWVDSAGVGVLVRVFKAGRAHGASVRYAGAREEVLRVLEIIKLDRILDIR